MTRFVDLETAAMREVIRRQPPSALGEWYAKVRERNIEDLEDDDLCRACRQALFPEAIVPIALARLAVEPLAGDMYEGEMLASLLRVPPEYWSENEASRRMLGQVLASARGDMPSEVAADIAKLQALTAPPSR